MEGVLHLSVRRFRPDGEQKQARRPGETPSHAGEHRTAERVRPLEVVHDDERRRRQPEQSRLESVGRRYLVVWHGTGDGIACGRERGCELRLAGPGRNLAGAGRRLTGPGALVRLGCLGSSGPEPRDTFDQLSLEVAEHPARDIRLGRKWRGKRHDPAAAAHVRRQLARQARLADSGGALDERCVHDALFGPRPRADQPSHLRCATHEQIAERRGGVGLTRGIPVPDLRFDLPVQRLESCRVLSERPAGLHDLVRRLVQLALLDEQVREHDAGPFTVRVHGDRTPQEMDRVLSGPVRPLVRAETRRFGLGCERLAQPVLQRELAFLDPPGPLRSVGEHQAFHEGPPPQPVRSFDFALAQRLEEFLRVGGDRARPQADGIAGGEGLLADHFADQG